MTNEVPSEPTKPSPVELPAAAKSPLLPAADERFACGPLPARCGWNEILSALLRQPGRIIYQLHEPADTKRLCAALAVIAIVCLTAYGVVVGEFSGADQLWAAPLKIVAGSLLTSAICMPSFYVLTCLGGAHEKLRLNSLAGLLLAATALNATLLVSFAPIAWIFSESTDSIAFISSLHLVLWSVGLYFSLRLLLVAATFLGVVDRGYLLVWMVMFTFVSLQMMTTLRPIVGRSDQFLPTEKLFFLSHWVDLFHSPSR